MSEPNNPESPKPESNPSEKNPILEKLGPNKLKWIAGLGLFAATAFGLDKTSVGATAGVETHNPSTGEKTNVGVSIATRTEALLNGMPQDVMDSIAKDTTRSNVFEVQVGSSAVFVFLEHGKTHRDMTVRLYAGAETTDSRDARWKNPNFKP